MNLYFRLISLFLFSSRRTRVSIFGPCLTPFHCWPTDLDILRHMTNSRYLAIMDLARVDLMIRAGLNYKIASQGWYPVVVAESIRFRKSLKLWTKFQVESVVLGWDDKAFLLQQRFLVGSECFAEAVVRARFLKKSGGSVLPTEIMALAEVNTPSPQLPEWIERWNQVQGK